MKTLRDSVYILVAVGSLALAVCQPSEAGAEPTSQVIDHAVALLGDALQPGVTQASR